MSPDGRDRAGSDPGGRFTGADRLTVGIGTIATVAGAALLALAHGIVATSVGVFLLGVAGVAFVELAFLLVGESEERDYARQRRPRPRP